MAMPSPVHVALDLPARLYGAAARWRRAWYARHPEARRRLRRPVVSVGNLRVGGSGKTPAVAHLARLLLEMGERPAILSRGYARPNRADGVVVVNDGRDVRADVLRAGDEPLMLARSLEGVAVLVSPDRYLSGRIAETCLGCTVHLLDDGFQHFELERDVDLLLVSREDLEDPRLLPAGRLREPMEAAGTADAVIVSGADRDGVWPVARQLRIAEAFQAVRTAAPPTLVEPAGRSVAPAPGTRVLAVAGIARPERFFADLRAAGWVVAAELVFADHHLYSANDVERIVRAARESRSVMVLTTEKDLVRLLPRRPFPIPLAAVPLRLSIEPARVFRRWLGGRLDWSRRAGVTRCWSQAPAEATR
jgi:tetraacyldisaccharide 4'-kinase